MISRATSTARHGTREGGFRSDRHDCSRNGETCIEHRPDSALHLDLQLPVQTVRLAADHLSLNEGPLMSI